MSIRRSRKAGQLATAGVAQGLEAVTAAARAVMVVAVVAEEKITSRK